MEALRGALERLSTAEIKLSVIHSAAGAVNKDDVALASASNAIIIGFHIRPAPNAQALADQEKVEIRKYEIIYEVIDDVRSAMEGLLTPDIVEATVGSVEVRDLFRITRIGTIAGSYVVSGTVRRGALAQVIRDGRPLYRGKIVTLRRFKDDVREVEVGFECGIRIEGFNDVKVGDAIDVIEQRTVAKKLGEPTANGTIRPARSGVHNMSELRLRRAESFLGAEISRLISSNTLKDPRIDSLVTVAGSVLPRISPRHGSTFRITGTSRYLPPPWPPSTTPPGSYRPVSAASCGCGIRPSCASSPTPRSWMGSALPSSSRT